MEYFQLVESIVEGLLKDATSMFEPKVMKELTTPSYLSRERITNMPIKTFLKLASELRHGEEPSKKERIETALNSGEKIYEVPHLSFNIKDEIAKVTGHEGRHRALALLRRGFTHMPVSLHAKDSMSGTIRWSESNNPSHSSYVKTWPNQLIGQDQRGIVSFPVKREEGHLPYVPPQDMEESFNKYVDNLLTEIIKANLGFGEPVSKNIRSGALFGGIIKDARAEGEKLGLRGVSGLNIVPMGGAGARIAPAIDTETYSGEKKTLPPAIYASVPSKKTGGVAGARQSVAHEVGHLLNGDLEPEVEYRVRPKPEKEPRSKMSPQPKLEREVKAVATERDFAGRHGIEINPEQDQRNLNTYRRGIMRPVEVSPEEQRRAHAQQDLDTDETIAILQKKYTVPSEIPTTDFSASRAVMGKDIYADTYTHRAHELLRLKGN